jgi:hypothetical protein
MGKKFQTFLIGGGLELLVILVVMVLLTVVILPPPVTGSHSRTSDRKPTGAPALMDTADNSSR